MTLPDPEQPGWQRAPATDDQRRMDVLAAAGLFGVGVLSLVLSRAIGFMGDSAAHPVVSLVVLMAITFPLAVRRQRPSLVAIIISAAYIVGSELHTEEQLIATFALFWAIYSVGAWQADRRQATWVRGGLVAGLAIAGLIVLLRITDTDLGLDGPGVGALTPVVAFLLQQLLINVLFYAGAIWFGERAWHAARQRAIIDYRTQQLAVEQARLATQAITIERLRIARELHDSVAHHVSLMGVQSAAARTVLPDDPDAAIKQLTQLEDSARQAVTDLYALLGTLRDADTIGDDALDGAPTGSSVPDAATATLGLDDLPALVDEARAAGLSVSLSHSGVAVPVPALTGLNLYRIAQEALTNVMKHAGVNARTQVHLRYLPNTVELEVSDDGRGRPRPRAAGSRLGLIGMRERVASLQGQLTAGPRTHTGFVVRASLPLFTPRPLAVTSAAAGEEPRP